MYPILMRLADRGLLETTWERDVWLGRPPRHMYRLTSDGRALAAELAPIKGLGKRVQLRLQPEGI